VSAAAPRPRAESDAVQAVAERLRACAALERWEVTGDEGAFWVEYVPTGAGGREAGTKIHVSSAIGCAAEVLSRCASVLLYRRVAFKHAADLRRLSFLSSGRAGASQVGKFITAYPPDDDAARELACELHELTRGFSGPRVPHEQPYAEDSLVSFRYGAFVQHWLQMCSGRVAPAMLANDRWQLDERVVGQPAAADHTDGRRHLTTGPQAGARVLRDKYVRVRRLFHSPKGSTHLSFVGESGDDGQLVIVKEAYAHTMEDLRGVDARRRLRDEYQCLTDIEAAGVAPTVVDYWETPDSAFLAYKPIEGATLTLILSNLSRHGLRPSAEVLHSWASLLCTAVQRLHRCGYVSCDLKPANLVMTGDRLFILDLELAGPPTDEPTGGMGTQGYASPQQVSHRAGRGVADDVYSIGATLLAMATLCDASLLPDLKTVAALEAGRNPDDRIYDVIGHCVDDEAERRPASAAAILTELASDGPKPRARMPAPSPCKASYLELASRIGDRIMESAVRSAEHHSYWLSNHSTMNGQAVRDLYCGSAGIALYLCALFGETGRSAFLEEALRCGTWLWESDTPVPRHTPMPGLYYGDCGAALLYLKLYQLSSDADWLERARSVSDDIHRMEITSPDIMTGLAGVGLYDLMLWRVGGDWQALTRARACARELIDRRLSDKPLWRFPDDFDLFGGSQYLGFGHGSAGIGYFLAECCLAFPDAYIHALCHEIADWLVTLAEPALVDGSGLTWRASQAPESPYMTAWCHGAPGIARFLLLAHEVTSDSAHLEAALRAGSTVARGAPWSGTTQCHGLAGNVDVLMDVFLYSDDQHYLRAANELGDNLRVYETPAGWPSDELSTGCLDLMVGEAGVGMAFLRLANPRLPHLISCQAFGRGSERTPLTRWAEF
jgi:serine/threonine protein kinase